MLSIGKFSLYCQVSVKTLRHYDAIGLLKPVFVDPETGYRYYDTDQMEQVVLIKTLKECGFSLQDIKIILTREETDTIHLLLARQKGILARQQAHLQHSMQILEDVILSFERTRTLMHENTSSITLRTMPAMPVIAVRRTIDMHEFHTMIAHLYDKAAQMHLNLQQPMGSMYFDEEFDQEHADLAVFLACPADKADLVIPAGQYVCATHYGPYHTLASTYRQIVEYIMANHLKISGDPYELYLNSPQNTAPEDLETEVFFPVILAQ